MTHDAAVDDVIEDLETAMAQETVNAFTDFVMLCRQAKMDAGRTFEALLSTLERRKQANHRGSLAVN